MHYINLETPAKHPFFESFPLEVVHPDLELMNIDEAEVNQVMKRNCPHLNGLPWTTTGAWNERPVMIRNELITAVKHINFPNSSLAKEDFDTVSRVHTQYPIVPDVAILFRCVDIISGIYPLGFMSFSSYDHFIPRHNVSFIYILIEPLSYQGTKQQSYAVRQCINLTERMVEHLTRIRRVKQTSR
jgi:hypothetical protein